MTRDSRSPRVVTVGGGHGQAVVLRALRNLECQITAVVATADDGGCSGELRRQFGMPPPGDLRRCLSALASDAELATRVEDRIVGIASIPRCRGNLVLAQRFLECLSLQKSADWVANRLGCVGRVMPASEESGTLVVCDRWVGLVEGELNVERTVADPLVGAVTGAYSPNEAALKAIADADFVIMGPGSFYSSTLSALQTGEVGLAVCRSSARRLFILNVANTDRLCASYSEADYISILSNHLTICSGGDTPKYSVLSHASTESEKLLEDGTVIATANMATSDGQHHSVERLTSALARVLTLTYRDPEEKVCVPEMLREELRLALDNAAEVLEALTQSRRAFVPRLP